MERRSAEAAGEEPSRPETVSDQRMTPDLLFAIASRAVLPGWLLLVFLPRWRWTARLISGVLIPALLGGLYLVILMRSYGGSAGGFGTLAEVRTLFENPWLLLMGWVHYLAFDLFIGSWEVRDAQRIGLHHLLVVPCLGLTLMFGPVGLLLYLLLRALVKRKIWLDDERSAA
jgi:hypothetical protein